MIDGQAHSQKSLLLHLSTQNDNEMVKTKRLKCAFGCAVKMCCLWVGISIETFLGLQMVPCNSPGTSGQWTRVRKGIRCCLFPGPKPVESDSAHLQMEFH